MTDESLTMKGARKQIQDLNSAFWSEVVLGNPGDSANLNRQLEQLGIVIRKSVLIDVFPDGENQFEGRLIRQDGKICGFSVDLEDPASADLQVEGEPRPQALPPWSAEMLAREIFAEVSSQRGTGRPPTKHH